jgi:pyridoxamine 5'-phosphate oxidase
MSEAPEDTDIAAADDPVALFQAWFAEAKAKEPNDPEGVALATADAAGRPDVRMVLLKEADARGFVFYTNLESAKGTQLAVNPNAALCFYWKSLRRQVRVMGPVEKVNDTEADAYFATRARDSQIGAWASKQSRPLEGRFALEREVARYAAKFALGKVPRPPYWSGFRVRPLAIEFWCNRPFRLHARLAYRRDTLDSPWRTERLFP